MASTLPHRVGPPSHCRDEACFPPLRVGKKICMWRMILEHLLFKFVGKNSCDPSCMYVFIYSLFLIWISIPFFAIVIASSGKSP
jgi:hypothetical protein